MYRSDVTFHPSWWHKHCGIDFNQDFFDDAEYRINCDVQMRKCLYDKFKNYGLGEKNPQPRPILGSDLIASGYLYSEILGCDIRYTDNAPPEVICKKNIPTEFVKLSENKTWNKTINQVDCLMKKFGYVLPAVNLQGIQNIAIDVCGSDFLINYCLQPDENEKVLSIITDLSIQIGKYFKGLSNEISNGVTAITKKTVPSAYVTSNCTVDLISADFYEEFLLQYDIELAKSFSSFGVHHCGKSMERVSDSYAKIKRNLEFAEVGAFSDIARVRRSLPNTHLNIRYSPVSLKNNSLPKIKEEVLLSKSLAGAKELVSLSCVGIDSDVSDEKVCAYLEYAQD